MGMQLLPPLTNDPRLIDRETCAGVHLPYVRHLDDITLETRDGLLMQTIRIGGLLFETAETEMLNYRAELRAALLRTLGTSRFAIWHHMVRREAASTLEGAFDDPFSAELDNRWRARLNERVLFVNDLYLTVIRRPLPGRLGLLDRMRSIFQPKDETGHQSMFERQALTAATDALIAGLSAYEARRLSLYDTGQGLRSEPVEFLGYLLNAEMHPRALPFGDIGDHLSARRISFGQDAFELGPSGKAGRQFGAIISIKDYPGRTMPGMFDELYRMPFAMTASQSFAFVERNLALGRMNLALRRMRATDDEALSLRDDLSVAKDEVAAGRANFGEHHMTVALHAGTLEALNDQVSEVTACLADIGIVGVREDIALEPAFWAQFPGNFRYIGRRGLVSTDNFSGLASFHNFPAGQRSGNHWGDAVTLLETTAAGPYFFNFHKNDLGNFTIIGPSGSGKTVVLNFLLAQSRRFSPRIVFFDKDRGAELFIRASGGQYQQLRPGKSSVLNPLQIDDSPANRKFLSQWLDLLAGGTDVVEAGLIADSINANFQIPRSKRRLRHLVELMRGHERPHARDLWSRMQPWCGEGERAWLFDNADDGTDLGIAMAGFDMTAILDDPVLRTPSLLYLFHRVEERLDGTPTIIVVDEGWKALDDEVFVHRIKDWEKTIRKRNGVIGFATQSAQDALESRIASAIIEQAATQIFMVNPRARAEDYMDGFGLTAHELELIRTLPDSSHCFLIRHGHDSVVARLNLSREKDLLTILSGREASVRLFDTLSAELGTSPSAWMAPLLEQT